jgi:xanthine dehydrogenase accessory factor
VKELREIIALWEKHSPHACALATLVQTAGSSYRRPGARMLITSSGETAGALSAGCIEDEVALHARDVIASGQPKLVAFDTRRRFGCNGSIEIFIQRTDDEFISQLRDRLAARESCDVVTEFGSNAALVQTIQPPIRLLVIGDGADARALTAQAQLLGWDVHVVAAINELRVAIDDRTAALIATHNFGRDCAALRQLMPLGLRYVGLIGPRRRREELLLDVIDSGAVTKSQLFAPAGLHLAAETPEEIALSIIAEVQAVFAGGTGQHLRDRKTPIHANSSAECATSAR